MRILLSIKPEYVEKIFDGTKRYEYRKALFKRPGIKTVVVYSTQPVGQIVGEFDVDDVLCSPPAKLWGDTQNESGIDVAFFDSYFAGRERAMAIKIGDTRKYPEPVEPSAWFDNFVAPQSFRYLPDSIPTLEI